jgi:hypothetical protein
LGSFNCQNHTKKYFIKLWEQRNEEVHGKTTEQQETTRKTKLSIDARKLNNLKDKARPVDMGLFHADIKEFLDNSTAQTIATYIIELHVAHKGRAYADRQTNGIQPTKEHAHDVPAHYPNSAYNNTNADNTNANTSSR